MAGLLRRVLGRDRRSRPPQVGGVPIQDFFGTAARRDSPDRPIGDQWLDSFARPYRAGWVENTGEVYALWEGQHPDAWANPHAGGTVVFPSRYAAEPLVQVLATVSRWERVEETVRGWEEVAGQPGSLEWLQRRFAPHGGVRTVGR